MKIPNGCGPAWIPRWLTSLLFNWFFEASCIKHDEGYKKGGDEIRRFECDWKFLQAMRRDTKKVRWWLRPIVYVEMLAFFGLVRIGGWLHFNYEYADEA